MLVSIRIRVIMRSLIGAKVGIECSGSLGAYRRRHKVMATGIRFRYIFFIRLISFLEALPAQTVKTQRRWGGFVHIASGMSQQDAHANMSSSTNHRIEQIIREPAREVISNSRSNDNRAE
jgi:hypothetical protein